MIEIRDQPLAERIVAAALGREDPPQQLLLHGPPGTGKRDAARAIAWQLIAPGAGHDPAEESLDLSVVRGTGTLIRLEDLEPALADLAARPATGARRVMVIEGAERLSETNGAHRILKPLEEPPPRSHVILVTDRPSDLLPTIRSRCLPVPFRNPGWRAIARRLRAEGLAEVEAEDTARADGLLALAAGRVPRQMRALGVSLALSALAGPAAGPSLARDVQIRMIAVADQDPSPELLALRAEASAKAGKRGERTALKRVEDQEKRERRRAVTDGWAHVLDGAAGLVADALAVAVGAEGGVRHRSRLDALRPLAAPSRAPFLERALEEIQVTRSEMELNPTMDLAIEALLGRLAAARRGKPGPLHAPGRLPF